MDEQYKEGFIDCYGLVSDVADEMLKSINNVMSIYMSSDYLVGGREDSRLAELKVMYDSIRGLSQQMEDSYFEKLDGFKYKEEAEELKKYLDSEREN